MRISDWSSDVCSSDLGFVMTDALDRKRQAITARRDASTFPGEVEACDAALARLDAISPTRAVVRRKELRDHQRRAWLCLVAGAGRLSKAENSFLHNVRERQSISDRQAKWLTDLEVRIEWEKSL